MVLSTASLNAEVVFTFPLFFRSFFHFVRYFNLVLIQYSYDPCHHHLHVPVLPRRVLRSQPQVRLLDLFRPLLHLHPIAHHSDRFGFRQAG